MSTPLEDTHSAPSRRMLAGGAHGIHPISDQRGLIGGFVVRLIIVFGILALVLNESGRIILAQVHASSAASAGAEAAASSFRATKNEALARAAANTAAKESDAGARVSKLSIATDGTATVTVAETADTLVLRRISFLRKYGIQRSTQSSVAPS